MAAGGCCKLVVRRNFEFDVSVALTVLAAASRSRARDDDTFMIKLFVA